MATTPCAVPADRRAATSFPGAFAYEHTDIPPGDDDQRAPPTARSRAPCRKRAPPRRAASDAAPAAERARGPPQSPALQRADDEHPAWRTPIARRTEDALFRRHHCALVRAVGRVVHASDALIEDACAIAWLQLIRTQPERTARLFGWLRTVAIHEAYPALHGRAPRHAARGAGRFVERRWL